MGAMTIRELNANVSQAIARVERGESLDITKHGKVVAELRAKAPVRDAAWFEKRDALVEELRIGLPVGAGRVTYEDKHGPDE